MTSSDENNQKHCDSCGCHPQEELAAKEDTTSKEDDFKDKYLRLLAETENFRKRVQKDSQDAIRAATQRVILDLLEPYENFEKALQFATESQSDEVRNWALGFKMIHQQFRDWLHAQGVHSFVSKGEKFNTQLHEAVEVKVSPDVAEGIVLEELYKGYKINDKVLRPSKVIIAGRIKEDKEALESAESDLNDDELSTN